MVQKVLTIHRVLLKNDLKIIISLCYRKWSYINFELLFVEFEAIHFELWLFKVENQFSKCVKMRWKQVIKSWYCLKIITKKKFKAIHSFGREYAFSDPYQDEDSYTFTCFQKSSFSVLLLSFLIGKQTFFLLLEFWFCQNRVIGTWIVTVKL